jgi:neutral ceramidase
VRRYFNLKFTLLISVVLLSVPIFCPVCQAALRGGCAKVNITPPVGVWLSGYGSRDKPSDSIVDELYAKSLVLDDGNNAIAIVSADLLWVPLEITSAVRGIVKKKTNIPESNVLVCATHTHFGPKIFAGTKIGPEVPSNTVDKSYVQTLTKKLADSVFLAYKNMQEVKTGAVKGEIPEIVYNRRPKNNDGSVKMTFSLSPEVIATKKIIHGHEGFVKVTFTLPPEEPELTFGPIDPEAWVLRVEKMNGEIVGSIINFACHAVSGSAYADWFYSISADFPGQTTRVVEQVEGGICLFTSGTAGNIVPIKRGRNERLQIGKALAGEVLKRLQFVPASNHVGLNAMKRDIKLPIKQTLSPDRIIDADKSKKHLTTEIQVLKIGDLYIVGLPGEVLVEVGLEIKKRTGLENLFVIALSNDTIGYVCHRQAYEEGGYEPGSGTNLAKGAGEIMIKEALNIISQIKQSK